MKRLLVLVAVIMTSCTLSNEQKAERLVKETLKNYLYHPDSYESTSIRVDSIFIDVTTITPIMEIGKEIKDLMRKIKRCEREVESAESDMDIYEPRGYSSQYLRNKYARAKKEKEKAESDLEKYTKKLLGQFVSLKENVAKYHKGEFTGWVVYHRYKCLNKAGTTTVVGDMVFFCDKEFADCEWYEDDEIDNFLKMVKAVEEATSDEDIIDYFEENSFLLF